MYSELAPHEAGLDYFIDLVRRDALDETVSLINLSKSIGFVAHVHGVHFAREKEDAAQTNGSTSHLPIFCVQNSFRRKFFVENSIP